MKRFFLFALLVVLLTGLAGTTCRASQPPETYMQFRQEFLSLELQQRCQDDYSDLVRRKVITGVAVGAALFVTDEILLRRRNEAYHRVMPYLAIGYFAWQIYEIIRLKEKVGSRQLAINICCH